MDAFSRRRAQAPLRRRARRCAHASGASPAAARARSGLRSRRPRQATPGRGARARVQPDALGRAGADRALQPRRGGRRRGEPRPQALRSAAHRPPGAVPRRSRNGSPGRGAGARRAPSCSCGPARKPCRKPRARASRPALPASASSRTGSRPGSRRKCTLPGATGGCMSSTLGEGYVGALAVAAPRGTGRQRHPAPRASRPARDLTNRSMRPQARAGR